MLVPDTARRALFNGRFRFSIAETMIFETIDAVIENLKNFICAMENPSILLNRARRVVFWNEHWNVWNSFLGESDARISIEKYSILGFL